MPLLYASERLKRDVGEFSGHCCEEWFCPMKLHETAQKSRRETGQSPSLPVKFSTPDSARFCLAGLRQNAQDKGNAEGLKKEQDKRRASQVTPTRATSSRSAGRFKSFRDWERGCMWGSHLNLGAHSWGLILRKWPLLAALSGGHCRDIGQNHRFEGPKK